MISLRQIRSFVAVYEEGSFTSAARREGATQSGISQHIKQLESELGVALFERNGRDVEPTLAGKLYYRECVDVLKKLEAAQQSVAINHVRGVIRVGLMPTFTRSVLAPALDKFLGSAPGSEISVIEAYSGVLTDMILKGELDFAVVPAFEGATGISHRLLARDREMLVSAKRDNNLKPVKLSELGPLKVVLPGPQNTRRRNIETYFSANGVAVAQRLELDAMMGTLQFVAASDWVAILPFVMMVSDLDDDRFDVRPLEDPPFYSEFVLIEPARKVMSPAAALFADILRLEAEQSRLVFQERTGAPRATRRRIVRSAD
ncbi:LysR family transcriptional regulator [Bradyrhizobium sp. URHD0069]|jgi:LysR family nitrogen assimilation transcriptional regulator|uniref:LysR family transcriptional regulator n=1 Tax=Bradyrhizobium sp. URHD0069 TaxID=1380355 RepID=UPI00049684AE|nr:LysR family transcriptional regulator [Bradyrhizobium sp. URHD0069]